MSKYVQIQSFDGVPPEEVRLSWCKWLRHHSVDPNDVAIPGRIGRFVRERQVRYLTWCFERGCTHELHLYDQHLCIVQLEAAPSPFPAAT